MPTRPGHTCVPGCAAIVPHGKKRCPKHTVVERRRQDERRGSSTARGYGSAWQRRRAAWLRLHPLCVECLRVSRTTAATVVDHVVPKSQGGADDESNFQSLCKRHHDAKTMRESVNR